MPDITITVHAVLDGFPVDIAFTGAIDQLPAITKRLRALGASEPVSRAQFTRKPKAPPVVPAYRDDGTPCCPKHNAVLRDGKWGPFCPARDQETGEWCKLRFSN